MVKRELHERSLGAVQTPQDIIDFMVNLASPKGGFNRVLEPACGRCPFLKRFSQKYGLNHKFVGVDFDPEVLLQARAEVPYVELINADFLLWEPDEPFDIIIGNPPYGIIGDASHYPIHIFREHKSVYKERFKTWFGKYNIYGAFIEHAVNLLKPDGKLIFVVPASWLILKDFSKLRSFLASAGRLSIFYIGKAFPRRNVSCVVFLLEKGKKGLQLYDGHRLVVSKPEYFGEIIRFETEEIIKFEKSGIPLGEVFNIYFAARSTEIKSHHGVSTTPGEGYVPVLTGRNLKAGWIDYDTCYSGLWMRKEEVPNLRFFYGIPHIVVGHTKGTRVVSAIDERCYPWREEFHLIPKMDKIKLNTVVDYLNSKAIQDYVFSLYRDFVPHLTKTMLELIPLPKHLLNFYRLFPLFAGGYD